MTWKADDAGQREWLLSSQAAAAVRPPAERIESTAKALAPHRTGHYAESFEVDVSVQKVQHGPPRQVATVTNTADYAAGVEYGYAGRSKDPGPSAHHVLSRAIDAAKE